MLIWVGRFYSDIIFSEYLFSGAITIYSYEGAKKNPCFSYLADDSKETVAFLDHGFKVFVLSSMETYIKWNSECRFLFYSDILATRIIEEYPYLDDYIVSVNKKQHGWLRSKTYSRLWLKDVVQLPGIDVVTKDECTIEILSNRFPNYDQFVIQENISSGGHGTFLLNKDTAQSVHRKLDSGICYVVAPYIGGSRSINTHVFISDSEILVFPYSFQDIIHTDDKLEFSGSIFTPDKNKKQEVFHTSYRIAEKLQKIGYGGICGIDLLVTEEDIFFVEVNCRYQGSTFIIDYLTNKTYGVSIFDMSMRCFTNEKLPLTQSQVSALDLEVLYSVRANNNFKFPFVYKESHMYRCVDFK